MLLEITADLGQLSKIREFVLDSAKTLGADPTAFDDLRLAVDEAVTNILTHGYAGPGNIELKICADGSDLIIRLRDAAPSFDATQAISLEPGPAEEREKPGGFGLFLIKNAVDKLVHRALENGNELTMIKCGVIDRSAAPNPS